VKHDHRKLVLCPNCENQLGPKDNFCPNCGQENHDLKLPIRHLLFEVVEGLIHFDGKLFQTTKVLLLHPGRLTAEFRVGRRIRYVQPIRLYIFISFIFFLLLTVGSHKHSAPSHGAKADSTAQKAEPNSFNMSFEDIKDAELKGLNDAQIDSVLRAHDTSLTFFNRYMARQVARISDGGKEQYVHMLVKLLSNMMFVLMPVFAWLLYIFHRKRNEYYLTCLVFSVHLHCFIFLLFSAITLVGRVISNDYLMLASPLLIAVYFIWAMRTVFEQSFMRTLWKSLAIGALECFMIILCFIQTIFLSVALF
jgi:hypothetical protein